MTEKTDEEIVKEVEKNYGVSTHLIEQVIKTTIPIAKEAERKKHEEEIESLYSKLKEYKKELQKKIEKEKLKKSDYGAGVCFANTIFNDVFFEERKRIMSIE